MSGSLLTHTREMCHVAAVDEWQITRASRGRWPPLRAAAFWRGRGASRADIEQASGGSNKGRRVGGAAQAPDLDLATVATSIGCTRLGFLANQPART